MISYSKAATNTFSANALIVGVVCISIFIGSFQIGGIREERREERRKGAAKVEEDRKVEKSNRAFQEKFTINLINGVTKEAAKNYQPGKKSWIKLTKVNYKDAWGDDLLIRYGFDEEGRESLIVWSKNMKYNGTASNEASE